MPDKEMDEKQARNVVAVNRKLYEKVRDLESKLAEANSIILVLTAQLAHRHQIDPGEVCEVDFEPDFAIRAH